MLDLILLLLKLVRFFNVLCSILIEVFNLVSFQLFVWLGFSGRIRMALFPESLKSFSSWWLKCCLHAISPPNVIGLTVCISCLSTWSRFGFFCFHFFKILITSYMYTFWVVQILLHFYFVLKTTIWIVLCMNRSLTITTILFSFASHYSLSHFPLSICSLPFKKTCINCHDKPTCEWGWWRDWGSNN